MYTKFEVVKSSGKQRQKRSIMVELKLCVNDRESLDFYLCHLNMSLAAFVRKLVLKEMQEETFNYNRED